MFRQLIFATLVALALGVPSTKINQGLLTTLKSNGVANVIITFSEKTHPIRKQVDSMRFASRGMKITTLKSQLETLATKSQAKAASLFASHNLAYKSFWINNRMYVRGINEELVRKVARLPNVAEVREEIIAHIPQPIVSSANPKADWAWGITKIEAENAWGLKGGSNGTGVVIASIDTGVRVTHMFLRDNYRGEYGWFDPYTLGPEPVDAGGHGTHTMGTIAGSLGIGVAPGAKWAACRGCSTYSCSENSLLQCGQWIACPTAPNGDDADCSKAPNVVSNSWGGGGTDFYDEVIATWHTADVTPVFSIGNSGPNCGTTGYPGEHKDVIGVASTTITDGISDFSSRGSASSGTLNLKPDVSAPGHDVRSTWFTTDTSFHTLSGTSMACPHVAGTVAILKGQNPTLTYTEIKDLLQDNADRQSLEVIPGCDNVPTDAFPNFVYGYGRINARSSMQACIDGDY